MQKSTGVASEEPNWKVRSSENSQSNTLSLVSRCQRQKICVLEKLLTVDLMKWSMETCARYVPNTYVQTCVRQLCFRASGPGYLACLQAGTVCCVKLIPRSVTSSVFFDFQARRSSFGIWLQLTKSKGYLLALKICLGTLRMRVLSHIIRDKEILASAQRCWEVKTPLFSHQNLQEKEDDTTGFLLLASSQSRLLQHYFPLTPRTHFFCQEQI